MNALYIGRFQVFHLGHLDVVRHIAAAADVQAVVLMLGSSQYDHTRKSPVATWSANPFTATERRAMIEGAIGALGKPWSLHEVADRHDWPKWYADLVAAVPPFGVLYTSDAEERAFFGARGVQVRGFPRERRFHAGTIRTWLAEGGPWRAAVPPETAAILEQIDAPARMRELIARDQRELGVIGA